MSVGGFYTLKLFHTQLLVSVENMCTAKKFIMAGYSGTPLLKKLGITESAGLFLVNAPVEYGDLLGIDVKKQLVKKIREADFFHIFCQHRKELEKQFTVIVETAKSSAVVWISWYKKSSKIPTDITEDVIREIVLPTGWVDVKVCAVTDVWSGLKIVKRVKNR